MLLSYLVHLTCQSTDNAETDLTSTVQQLFQENNYEDADLGADDTKPRVLWSLYFSMTDVTSSCLHCHIADNVVVVSGPDASLDFDHSIEEARKIFEQICGTEEEFLPAAPAPEDIIYDDGEGKTPADSGFSSCARKEGSGDGTGNGKATSGDVIGEGEGEGEGRKTEEKREAEEKESGDMLEGATQGEGDKEMEGRKT
ncbi:hypothetical protein NP493_1455g00001 [Ridgeia piscesae]|uniref:RAE1/2 domain-containing protein n=1 Tax=Ridgeia piscesae TaxID=27915 RepID=A0AAD9K3T1_RIDPI|nr:hypothetical protein NP493_1455g00001 [Ridgeia piscesae]